MDIKDIIRADYSLREPIIAAFIRDFLRKAAMSQEEARASLMDLNPHIEVLKTCDKIVKLIKADLDETVNKEFVMSVWLTDLHHDHLQNQLNKTKHGASVRLLDC